MMGEAEDEALNRTSEPQTFNLEKSILHWISEKPSEW